jgi:hypothetical protein
MAGAFSIKQRLQCSHCHGLSKVEQKVCKPTAFEQWATFCIPQQRPSANVLRGSMAEITNSSRRRKLVASCKLLRARPKIGLDAYLERLLRARSRNCEGRGKRPLTVPCSSGSDGENQTEAEDKGGKGIATITEEKEPVRKSLTFKGAIQNLPAPADCFEDAVKTVVVLQ